MRVGWDGVGMAERHPPIHVIDMDTQGAMRQYNFTQHNF